VPTALAVANATNHGRPIVLARPDHPVSKSLIRLARSLSVEAVKVAKDGKTATKAGGKPIDAEQKRGVFGRRKK
jgi:pilus assembly protein CpaE